MLQFYALLLVDALVFQPLRCVFGLLMRFLWQPPDMEAAPPSPMGEAELRLRAAALYISLDRNKYGQDADSAKFLGMLAFATGRDDEWRRVMDLVQDDGSLKRSLAPEDHAENAAPFSPDLLSGFLLAVLGRLERLTVGERVRLAKVWERTTWQGWPLLLAHPLRGKQIFERGHLWTPWWVFGCEEILAALAWLRLGWRISGEGRYLWAYWAFMILQAPSLLIASADVQVWLGRVYALAAHNIHSKALIFYVGYKLTGSRRFKAALRQAYARHGAYNADICLLAGEAAGAADYKSRALALIADALAKGTRPCPEDRRYLSLIWPPEMVTRSARFMPPSARGADYVWERSPIKGSLLGDASRARLGLDVIFPAMLLGVGHG